MEDRSKNEKIEMTVSDQTDAEAAQKSAPNRLSTSIKVKNVRDRHLEYLDWYGFGW